MTHCKGSPRVSVDWLVRETGAKFAQETSFWIIEKDIVVFYIAEGLGWDGWLVEATILHPDGHGPKVVMGGSYYEFNLGRSNRPHSAIGAFKRTLVTTGKHPFPQDEWVRVQFKRGNGSLSLATSAGCELRIADPDPGRFVKDLTFEFPAGTRFRDFSVTADGRMGPAWQPTAKGRLLRSVSIDFNDDVIPGPWTLDTVYQQMHLYKESGIGRVYFLPTAHVDDGYWLMPNSRHRDHLLQTKESIGDFLPAFAAAAKSNGLEFFAVYKPFDLGFEKNVYPFVSNLANEYGGFHSLSGIISRSSHWLKAHADKRLRRHPGDLKKGGEIRRLVLRPEIEAAGVEFSLWASPDNSRYEKVTNSVFRHASGEVEFNVPFGTPSRMAIVRECGSVARFGNRLRDLVRCYDDESNEVAATFAVAGYGEFPATLFRFDANLAGRQPADSRDGYWWMEEGTPLGFTAGYEPFIIGAPSPAWPEVRQHWLDEIARCLDCGCDGVDIRVANHNRSFDWDCYGFDAPVLAETGPDPSAEAVRSCLGRHYSRFISDASRMAKSRGRQLQVHLEHGFRPAHLPCDMNIAFEWERWLEEQWVDEVTLVTHAAAAGIMPLMARKAQELGIPVNIRPYFNSMVRGTHAEQLIEHVLKDARACGMDGLNIYESASFFSVDQNANVKLKPDLARWWEVLVLG